MPPSVNARKRVDVSPGTYNYALVPGGDVPAGVVGGVDLRSTPQRAGTTPGGYYFAVLEDPAPTIPGAIALGQNLNARLSVARRNNMAAALGLQSSDLDVPTLLDALWDVLTVHGDPTGETRNNVLHPNNSGKLELLLSGHNFSTDGEDGPVAAYEVYKPVISDRFDETLYPKVFERYRQDYERFRASGIDSIVLLKFAGSLRNQFGKDVRTEAQQLRDGPPVTPTTEIEDLFDRAADADELGTNASGWTWADQESPAADPAEFNIISSERGEGTETGTVNNPARTRAETALSTVNHWASVDFVSGLDATDSWVGPVVHFAEDGSGVAGYERALGPEQSIKRWTADGGFDTTIDTTAAGDSNAKHTRVEVNGTTFSLYVDGVFIGAGTDVGTTALKVGIATQPESAKKSIFDNFHAGDIEDVEISSLSTVFARKKAGRSVKWISPSICYVFMQYDSAAIDYLVYWKTTDAGLTWGSPVTISNTSNTIEQVDIWYSKQTDESFAPVIHITWLENTSPGSLHYRSLDPLTDTLGTDITVKTFTNALDTSVITDRNCSITQSEDTYLHVFAHPNNLDDGTPDTDLHFFSDDAGATWATAESGGALSAGAAGSWTRLLPWNDGTRTGDICAIIVDADIQMRVYNSATDTWSNGSFSTAGLASSACVNVMNFTWNPVNRNMYFQHWTNATTSGVLNFYRFDNSTTAETVVQVHAADASNAQLSELSIDTNTNKLTSFYCLGRTKNLEIRVWKSVSTDHGLTWTSDALAMGRYESDYDGVWADTQIGSAGGWTNAVWQSKVEGRLWTNVSPAKAQAVPPATTSILQHHRIGVPLGVGL